MVVHTCLDFLVLGLQLLSAGILEQNSIIKVCLISLSLSRILI